MKPNAELCLHEEILLLALHDRKGVPIVGIGTLQALAGALLAELLLRGNVHLGAREAVELVRLETSEDALLDECLESIAQQKKPKNLRWWVMKLAQRRELLHRTAAGLCERGILRADKRKILFFFEQRIYPEANAAPERALAERLREVILTGTPNVDERTLVLLSLAYKTNLLKPVVGAAKLRDRKKRIERVIEGEALGRVAGKVTEATQAAILVSTCVVPIIAS
ncbi:MAG: GPP34 family phosphoprotein [bacterium]|nr:GPP34 family phosphoprotein [bacterium]